jgi:polyribonucleotide nucleotidyltransferase
MDVSTVSNVSFSRPSLGHSHDEARSSANRCEAREILTHIARSSMASVCSAYAQGHIHQSFWM